MEDGCVILVVSHDLELADVRKRRLQQAGYEVVSAMDVQSIRAACFSGRVRLAVIGYSLPPAEKRRAALEVRQGCGTRTPILLLGRGQKIADVVEMDHNSDQTDSFTEHIRRILA